MRRFSPALMLLVPVVVVAVASSALAQDAAMAKKPEGVAKLAADAAALEAHVESPLAKTFLAHAASGRVPDPGTRELIYNRESRRWLTVEEGMLLPPQEQSQFAVRKCAPDFYFETNYGSPLVFARVLDVASAHGFRLEREKSETPAIMDFGYGTIGHLMLTASMCVDAVGVDIDPLLPRLYKKEREQSSFTCFDSESVAGLHLIDGRWPSDPAIAQQVSAIRPGGFDLITSKNTLKNGYVNPPVEISERQRVTLGVSNERFAQAVFEALKPGGFFIIYNLSPRPPAEGQPFRPMTDGRSPFSKEMLEKAGFEVLAFDTPDDDAAIRIFTALGYPTKTPSGEQDLFALYTVARRPSK